MKAAERTSGQDALFTALAAAVPPKLAEFKPQEIATTAWAYATVNIPAPELFAAIAAIAPDRLGSYRAQDLADLVWAFAKGGVAAPALFDAVAAVATPRRNDFNSSELASIVWAYTKAGVAAPELFDAISRSVRHKLEQGLKGRNRSEFSVQDLAHMAWAFTHGTSSSQTDLLQLIARAAPSAVPESSPVSLAHLLRIVAQEPMIAHEHFSQLTVAVSHRLTKFSADEVSKFFVHACDGSKKQL